MRVVSPGMSVQAAIWRQREMTRSAMRVVFVPAMVIYWGDIEFPEWRALDSRLQQCSWHVPCGVTVRFEMEACAII